MFDVKNHLINLKGKDYLQVMWRLVWFRDEHPDWCISTELVSADENGAIFHAVISDETGTMKSSGYGSETKRDFGDYLEKAETKSVGRALAMLGYGTQFAPEMDEEERIVDSPVAQKKPKKDECCDKCGSVITGVVKEGKIICSPEEAAERSRKRFGKTLCLRCATEAATGAD